MNIKTMVYIASIEPLQDRLLFQIALQQASAQRREKVLAYHNDLVKRQALGVELLLRKGLEAFGFSGQELVYEYGENGKPSLAQAKEIHFNFSHSGDVVMCAVSTEEVGCDIEKIVEKDLKIAERFFCKEEAQAIQSASSEEEKRERFFRFWAMKESFMKLTGLGMRLPMNAFQVMEEDGSFYVTQGRQGERYELREWDQFPGYRCALCQKEIPADTVFEIVDLGEMLNDSFQSEGHKVVIAGKER